MDLYEYVKKFCPVERGLPAMDGLYEVMVRTESVYTGGTFLTQLEFQSGSWVAKEGYFAMTVLSWLLAESMNVKVK